MSLIDGALVASPALLGATFLVAGLAKLSDPGTADRNLARFKDPGELPVLRQRDYEVAEDFDITTSPAAIVVDASGTIASPLAMGGQAILQLIADTAAAPVAIASVSPLATEAAPSGEAP